MVSWDLTSICHLYELVIPYGTEHMPSSVMYRKLISCGQSQITEIFVPYIPVLLHILCMGTTFCNLQRKVRGKMKLHFLTK